MRTMQRLLRVRRVHMPADALPFARLPSLGLSSVASSPAPRAECTVCAEYGVGAGLRKCYVPMLYDFCARASIGISKFNLHRGDSGAGELCLLSVCWEIGRIPMSYVTRATVLWARKRAGLNQIYPIREF